MTTTFVHAGDSIDYVPVADVAAGQVVVLNDLVGVAKRRIPAGKLGALAVTGVFDVPKDTGLPTGIQVGRRVYWDQANGWATKASAGGNNILMGTSVLEAASDDAIARIRLAGFAQEPVLD